MDSLSFETFHLEVIGDRDIHRSTGRMSVYRVRVSRPTEGGIPDTYVNEVEIRFDEKEGRRLAMLRTAEWWLSAYPDSADCLKLAELCGYAVLPHMK